MGQALEDYYNKVLDQARNCVKDGLHSEALSLASAHQNISDFRKLCSLVENRPEYSVFGSVCQEMQAVILYGLLGAYRQAYMTLRVVLETSIAALYYSSQPIYLKKWMKGEISISWTKICSDEGGGVLTKKYSEAFWEGDFNELERYSHRAGEVYSCLSGYVHRNNNTKYIDEIHLIYSNEELKHILGYFDEVVEIVASFFCVRYIDELSPPELEEGAGAIDALVGTIPTIQKTIGGQSGG